MNRLKSDDVYRMVMEAEEFATQDAELRKCIEKLNELSTVVWQLKSQIADTDGFGGKLSDGDKKTLQEELTHAGIWLEGPGKSATMDEIEERFVQVQAVVSPITSALYRSPGFQGGQLGEGEEDTFKHLEL